MAGGLLGDAARPAQSRMLTAALKLADVAARSLFVLLALFVLPAHEAGQFGLLLTFGGLFSFAVGFERYLDLQRQLGHLPPPEADQLLLSAMRLYGAHALVALPLLATFLHGSAKLPAELVGAGIAVAIGELLGNESYRVALTLPRYRAVMVGSLIKNILVLGSTAALWWWNEQLLHVAEVLLIWAFWSVLSMALIGGLCWRLSVKRGGPVTSMVAQWRASKTHFMIGLVAILSLQADRLVAGSLLDLDNAGVYFRHVFLASLVFQVLGVLSFNRVMPAVYRRLAEQDFAAAREILRREKQIVIPLSLAVAVAAWGLLGFDAKHWPALTRLVPPYLAVLVIAFLLRGLADYNSLLLNGTYRERDVFRSQLFAVTGSVISALILTPMYGIPGLLGATLFGSALSAAVSGYLTRRSLLIFNS